MEAALPPTATERDFSSVDFQQLILGCHDLDTMEAEQQASHPSDDSKSEMRLIIQRLAALEKTSKPDNRRGSAAAAANTTGGSPATGTPTGAGKPVETKRQPTPKVKSAIRGAHTAVMAADPPDAAVHSVHVRASAVKAASTHAWQHARASPGLNGSAFNILS